MSKFILAGLMLASSVMSVSAYAAQGQTEASVGAQAVRPEAISTSHKLTNSYFDSAWAGTALPAGTHTTVGTTLSYNCGNTAGCTISSNLSAQLPSGTLANAVAVCLYVDGAAIDGCPYSTVIPANTGSYQSVIGLATTTVTMGVHTIDMKVFSSQASTLYRWIKEIRVHKPWSQGLTL